MPEEEAEGNFKLLVLLRTARKFKIIISMIIFSSTYSSDPYTKSHPTTDDDEDATLSDSTDIEDKTDKMKTPKGLKRLHIKI